MTGYENHGGVTVLRPGAAAFGRVCSGVGNGAGGVDGAVDGRVWGTYLHGPVLARNPALADRLLELITGPLPPLDDREREALRAERLRAAPTEASGRTRGRLARLVRLVR
jgi:hypothetical protein